MLHGIAGDRRQGRSPQDLSGSQAEARVVQRTADRVIHQEPFVQRPAVVGTGRPDGEEAGPTTCHEDRLVIEVTQEHSVIGDSIVRYAPTEIGTGCLIARTDAISAFREEESSFHVLCLHCSNQIIHRPPNGPEPFAGHAAEPVEEPSLSRFGSNRAEVHRPLGELDAHEPPVVLAAGPG